MLRALARSAYLAFSARVLAPFHHAFTSKADVVERDRHNKLQQDGKETRDAKRREDESLDVFLKKYEENGKRRV